MKQIDFYSSSNIGQNFNNPISSLGGGGGGGGGHGSMDEVLMNPYMYSSAFTQCPVRSHTCSDGSSSAGSSEGFPMDQFMGLVFDPKCTKTPPLDETWFSHLSDFPYQSHHAAPDTSCSGNSPGSSDTSNFGLSDFGSWERQSKADIGLEEMFSPSLKKNKKADDEDLVQAGEIFVGSKLLPCAPIEVSKLIPTAPTEADGGLVAATSSIGFQRPLQHGLDEYTSLANRFNSSVTQCCNKNVFKEYTSGIVLDTFSNKDVSCPLEHIAGEDGALSRPSPNSVHVHQDNTRGFGLNPILGLPLGPTRCESDYNEICLVHLLIAGAEAVATRDMDLASVILVRLKELVSCTGTTMQRVAAYFTQGLQLRVELGEVHTDRYHTEPQTDILVAFQILHEVSPYIKFGHFTANEAILEAVKEERCVHIIDFEIMEGIQWPPLMQALASRKGGAPELKITALYRPHADRGLATVQETGKRLTEFASLLNVPFTFGLLSVNNNDEEEEVNVSSIKCTEGEALVANCMLDLPHMPRKTSRMVSAFVRGMRRLNPLVFTLVEEELGSGGMTMAAASFFFEALRHYSAVCDSLESCLEREIVSRTLVERVFVVPRINSTVAMWSVSCGSEAGTKSSSHNWCSLVHSLGFTPCPLSFHNVSQALLLLGLYKDGFKLDEISNRLLLGWRGKPLFAASVWK